MTRAPADTPGRLPRLLAGGGEGGPLSLDAHVSRHGPLPDRHHWTAAAVLDEVERAGLRGHGGAAFPTGRKLRAVAARRGPRYVVVNVTEGEPASHKDRVLIRDNPHLVLDGAALAARAVEAEEAFVAISEAADDAAASVALALAQRRGRVAGDPRFALVRTPDRYIAGQETALVNFLERGEAIPVFGARPYERGLRQRPTLVQNAETLAHLALIIRFGAAWFRGVGTREDPGSALVTLSGAIDAPGVYEIAHGTPLHELLASARPAEPIDAALVGGYFGTWLPRRVFRSVALAPSALREHRASLGAGVIVALGRSSCGVAETARIAGWFASESAGQCGPCVHGLAAVGQAVRRMAAGAATREDLRDLYRWAREIPGRGACQHPDGAVRFLMSALRVFEAEFAEHAAHGPCARCSQPSSLLTAA
jgi:NADH:ubiquinone oxidoreductase subunit F (NADH-binding)